MANVVEVILRGTDQLTAPFVKAGTTFQNQMAALSKVAAGFAVTAAGSLVVLATEAINTAEELGKMAQKVGIPVEELSRLVHAAHLADLTLEQLQTGLITLAKSMQERAEAFKQMGVEIRDAQGKLLPLQVVLEAVANKFATYKDGAEKAALASHLFGKAVGPDLIPLLNQGAEGIREAGKNANITTEEMSRNALIFNDNLKLLKTQLAAVGHEIAKTVLPDLIRLSFHMSDAAISARQLYNELKPYVDLFKLWQDTTGFGGIMKNLDRMVRVKEKLMEQSPLTPPAQFPGMTVAPPEVMSQEVERQQRQYDQLLAAAEQFNNRRLDLFQRFQDDRLQQERAGLQATLSTTAQMFGTMSRLAAVYGEKNFALQQGLQIGQAIMNTALGVTKALAEVPWPYDLVVAAMIGAMGAAEIAIIAGAKPQGQAHEGFTSIPMANAGSWNLSGGERILARNQNADLSAFLKAWQDSGTRPVIVQIDGVEFFRLIGEASRDGRLTLNSRSLAA